MPNWLFILFLSVAILLFLFLFFLVAEKLAKHFSTSGDSQFRQAESRVDRGFVWTKVSGDNDDGDESINEVDIFWGGWKCWARSFNADSLMKR
jgi:hypothetical protein